MPSAWDVAVIGAGPAGACAATTLARAGARVLLADREAFPRDKTCGDGVSADGLAMLEGLGLGDWPAERGFMAPQTLLLSAPNGDSVELGFDEPVVYGRVIPRRELDAALVGQAVAAGAVLAERFAVRELGRPCADAVKVHGACEGRERSERARLAVLAEGAEARLARQLGLAPGRPDLVAIRGYWENAGPPDDRLEIHYERALAPGYVWLFPLGGGRVNVGIGTHAGAVREGRLRLPEALQALSGKDRRLRERLAGSRPCGPARGSALRTGVYRARQAADNVLVAGEAAHLVNPLTGEGIAAAMRSGQMAAGQALAALQAGRFDADALRPYERALRRAFGAEHRAADLLRGLLTHPALINRLVRRAREDREFGLQVGLGIVGVTGARGLLHPRLLLRYLT